MTEGGIFSLGDIALTAADTYIGDWVDGLDGVTGLTAFLQLQYGSGGGSGVAYLQTSLSQAEQTSDAGIDIAAVSFTTTAKTVLLNFSGLTPKTTAITPTDGTMTSDTALDGVLGDRFRLKIVTTSTAYGGSTQFVGRISAR